MISFASFWRQKKKPIIVVSCIILGFLAIWWLGKLASSSISGGAVEVRENDWVKGGSRARATLVEYADFQCPACAQVSVLLDQMLNKYPDDLRLVYRYFPLTGIHPNAIISAKAAEAAGKQGKFWEMHDMLFEKQSEWNNMQNPVPLFIQYATELGMDGERFADDILSIDVADRVSSDASEASALALTGTPSLFLNGQKIQIQSAVQLESLIQDIINNSKDSNESSEPVAVHWHFGLSLVLNDKKIDLSLPKYQSTDEVKLDEMAHLHDGNGSIVHVHQTGVTLERFFKSIGMDMTSGCFTTDTGEKLCNTNTKEIAVYVNGEKEPRGSTYEPQDLDRILVIYGPTENLTLSTWITSVSDDACIYSKTCPERGSPPDESCVGGVAGGCEDESHRD